MFFLFLPIIGILFFLLNEDGICLGSCVQKQEQKSKLVFTLGYSLQLL